MPPLTACVGLPVALVPLLTASVVALTVTPAAAHTSLLSSSPAAGAEVVSPVEVVQVAFDQVVLPEQARIVVIAPDGADLAVGPAEVSGATASQPVKPFAVAGTYRLTYRVLAEDGHPITGELPFSVQGAAVGARAPAVTGDGQTGGAPTGAVGPARVPTAVGEQSPAGTAGEGGVVVPVLAGGLSLLGAGLVVGAVRSARRPRDAP